MHTRHDVRRALGQFYLNLKLFRTLKVISKQRLLYENQPSFLHKMDFEAGSHGVLKEYPTCYIEYLATIRLLCNDLSYRAMKSSEKTSHCVSSKIVVALLRLSRVFYTWHCIRFKWANKRGGRERSGSCTTTLDGLHQKDCSLLSLCFSSIGQCLLVVHS